MKNNRLSNRIHKGTKVKILNFVQLPIKICSHYLYLRRKVALCH